VGLADAIVRAGVSSWRPISRVVDRFLERTSRAADWFVTSMGQGLADWRTVTGAGKVPRGWQQSGIGGRILICE
jgi:hypothetical protein